MFTKTGVSSFCGWSACARFRALSAALACVAALIATTAPAADPPLQCTTERGGDWTITATGPTSVECPDGGACTAMDYEVVANAGRRPRRIALLVERDAVVVSPTTVLPPCKGDRGSRLGINDCSRQTVRFDLDELATTTVFQLVVEGTKAPSDSSIVIRRSERCPIAALGVDHFVPESQIKTSEQIVFKGCTVTIPTDVATGEGAPATISGRNCVFVANAMPVGTSELLINGVSVGNLTYGNGALSSGTSSCTTKVISNRLYTWCTCADSNDDRIPDDPIPPCPPSLS
jgi:hypothetical protein